MSQSLSYQRDKASASPESPKEGDFSPRQIYDNLKSLEEQGTCDDQKDPVVNIVPDNYSCSLLNAQICAPLATNDLGKLFAGMFPQEQPIKKSHRIEPRCLRTSSIEQELPVSPEFTEVCALDGRFITLVSSQTQTDWEWVEHSLFFSCQVQKEMEDPHFLQAEETKDEKIPEKEYEIPHVGLPRLIAYKPEPKQSPCDQKVPEVESKPHVRLAQCDYCQQPCQPFIHSELLENKTNFERLFCCEQAKQMREFILEEGKKLAQKDSDRKIDVNPHAPITSEEEREAARERVRQRLRMTKPKKDKLNKDNSHIEIKHKTSYRLSKEIPFISDEPHIPQIDCKNTAGMFTLQEETSGEPKLKEVIRKFYKSGKSFLTLCPDGTGTVFYPSGKAAIIVSSAEAADFTYIILEDKDAAASIKAIFTNKGHSTCYHPNGIMWLNLTPVGGLCFSETGDLRRHWNWSYFDPHVRNLPFKPLTFALGPHISVRIHSQEHMYVTFAHQKNTVRFSVGSKLKLICPENHDKPGQDILQRYIQMKSSEIYSLLGQMQTCVSHHSANLHNIKPHYRFIAQTQQLSREMKKEKSTEKIKAHVN
ncbi:glutamate-rich protein 6-like isoform X2 [Trachinotus anak]|uniref:glutamate-rich protein 6-like isoform X2 n=1 Tax=Trachinotus anak TaxID=443729 RepID=UPI0039F26350